jgi:hypothetical protein
MISFNIFHGQYAILLAFSHFEMLCVTFNNFLEKRRIIDIKCQKHKQRCYYKSKQWIPIKRIYSFHHIKTNIMIKETISQYLIKKILTKEVKKKLIRNYKKIIEFQSSSS